MMKEDKPTDAINKPLENSSEARDSLLSSMSRNARLSKGAMNYSDTMEQGAQINNELVILRQFNLVAFLTIMREFQEIKRLYNNDDRFSNKLNMLLEMERELEAKQRQTQFLYAEEERHRLSKNQEQVNQSSHDQDGKHRQLMNDLAMLRQLQQELQHLREVHYAQQNVLYDEISTLREEQMDEMLKIARKSDDISPKQLVRLEKIHEDHRIRKEQIDKMPTTDANGNHDWPSAKRKMEAHKKLHEDTSEKVKNWMHDNRHNERVQRGYDKHQVKIEEQEKVIVKNERVFKVHESKLEKQISNKLNTTNTAVAEQIGKISNDLKKVSLENNFSPEQSKAIQNEITLLKKYQKDVASSQSVEEQQQLLNTCKQTLANINQLVAPVAANSPSYKNFKEEVNTLQRMTLIAPQEPEHSISKSQNASPHLPPSMHSSQNDKTNGKAFEQFKSVYVTQRHNHESEHHEENEAVIQFKQSVTEFQEILNLVGEDNILIEELQKQVIDLQNNSPVSPELIESICETCNELCGDHEELQTIMETIKDLSQLISSSEMELDAPQGPAPGRRI
ncbi:MAG: hypothetical protein P4L79_06430 [Legionella sp.]|uniref:hypothetical protein n=1 Tax=Legionella sp. TaxID=459 RepID=UPI00283CD36A|nr:hypothetical protein [Legionella sp.]